MEKETLLNIIASALELDASEITFEISQKTVKSGIVWRIFLFSQQ